MAFGSVDVGPVSRLVELANGLPIASVDVGELWRGG
jgi:hypothetical protein